MTSVFWIFSDFCSSDGSSENIALLFLTWREPLTELAELFREDKRPNECKTSFFFAKYPHFCKMQNEKCKIIQRRQRDQMNAKYFCATPPFNNFLWDELREKYKGTKFQRYYEKAKKLFYRSLLASQSDAHRKAPHRDPNPSNPSNPSHL